MTDEELLAYIQYILKNSSQRKAELTLSELRDILNGLCTPPYQLALLDKAIQNLPDAMQEVKTAGDRPMTKQDLSVAARRAEERRRREEEMREWGRC